MFGLFAIDKPPGPTSHDVVAVVRRRLGRGVKVGHAGTLDPFADGVLVLCVGPATRLASYVQAQPKHYRAVVRLGATSSTDDPEGEITPTVTPPAAPDAAAVRETLGRFVGTIPQVPPAHSAVHVGGRRAYELARAGKRTELAARDVTIHAIELLRYDYPHAEIDVRCGCGTYIRALARDVGAALATGGYCEKLTRLAVGDFRIEQAVSPETLDPAGDLLPPLLAVAHLPRRTVAGDDVDRLRHGSRLPLRRPVPDGEVALVDADDHLLAIARCCEQGTALQPTKVFLSP